MSLFFDVTKSASARQVSGLIRVSERLRQEIELKLGKDLISVVWNPSKHCFLAASNRTRLELSDSDNFITPEVFSSEDRPGYHEHLKNTGVKSAAIFHDAIPLKHPDITWPQSVARHPMYMRNLASYSHVFSVSKSSQQDLEAYWDWLKLSKRASLSTLALGADFFDRSQLNWAHLPQELPLILNVGIIEPRKNQSQLLDVARDLWDEGLKFELHLAGRINPHFGKPIEKTIKQVRKAGYSVTLHTKQSDDLLLDLYSRAHFSVFNSIAEGFGLPVIESLWLGVPCISTSLPSLQGITFGRECQFVDSKDSLKSSVRNWLTGPKELEAASMEAQRAVLPRWSDTAQTIINWAQDS